MFLKLNEGVAVLENFIIHGFPDQDYLMNFEAPIIKEKNTLAVRFRLKMCEEGYFLSEMQNK